MIKLQTYDLLKPIVLLINRVFVGDGLSVDSPGVYSITSCNTLWLTIGSKVTIGGNNYQVIDIEPDLWIKLKALETPAVEPVINFIIDAPFFSHGTVLAKNQELSAVENSWDKLPMIYLHEIVKEQYSKDPESVKERDSDCNIYFMNEADPSNWVTVDHDKYALKPMRNLAFAFLEALENYKYIGVLPDYDMLDHANWGVYTSDKGHIKKIFDDDLSGVQLAITIPFLRDLSCDDCNTITNPFVQTVHITDGGLLIEKYPGESYTCMGGSGGVDATVRNTNSTYLQQVACGGLLVLADVTYNVNVNGVLNQTVTLPAAVNNTLNIS